MLQGGRANPVGVEDVGRKSIRAKRFINSAAQGTVCLWVCATAQKEMPGSLHLPVSLIASVREGCCGNSGKMPGTSAFPAPSVCENG